MARTVGSIGWLVLNESPSRRVSSAQTSQGMAAGECTLPPGVLSYIYIVKMVRVFVYKEGRTES